MSLSSKQLLDKNENGWSRAGPKWPFLQTRYESSSREIEIIRGWTFFDEDSFGSYVLDVKGIVICLTTLQIYMQFIKKYLTMFLFHSPRYAISSCSVKWFSEKEGAEWRTASLHTFFSLMTSTRPPYLFTKRSLQTNISFLTT